MRGQMVGYLCTTNPVRLIETVDCIITSNSQLHQYIEMGLEVFPSVGLVRIDAVLASSRADATAVPEATGQARSLSREGRSDLWRGQTHVPQLLPASRAQLRVSKHSNRDCNCSCSCSCNYDCNCNCNGKCNCKCNYSCYYNGTCNCNCRCKGKCNCKCNCNCNCSVIVNIMITIGVTVMVTVIVNVKM